MCHLLETIQCNNGKLLNLTLHQKRFDEARKAVFGAEQSLLLAICIQIPEFALKGLFRCRVIYSEQIESIEFIPYARREINTLKIVENNEIDYQFKYENREELNLLFEKRDACDDIIIIKNGLVTDSFVANIVCWDGSGWWTPNSPLLQGTQREKLLATHQIFERKITLHNLYNFEKIGLINAFNNLDEMPVVEISAIKS